MPLFIFLSFIWILPSKNFASILHNPRFPRFLETPNQCGGHESFTFTYTILICIYDGMPKMELCSIDDVPDIGKL